MTIETKMCEPINFLKLESLYLKATEFRELKHFVNNCWHDNPLKLTTTKNSDDELTIEIKNKPVLDEIVKVIIKRMEIIENNLNIMGYTMQDEPKEWQYHVNVLKGEDDE